MVKHSAVWIPYDARIWRIPTSKELPAGILRFRNRPEQSTKATLFNHAYPNPGFISSPLVPKPPSILPVQYLTPPGDPANTYTNTQYRRSN